MQYVERVFNFIGRGFDKLKWDSAVVGEDLINQRFDIAPEDIDKLLSHGYVEGLVEQSRVPVCIGKIGSPSEEMRPYYQIPPCGYDPVEIEKVYMGPGGAFVFKKKDGSQYIGPTFTLTEKQALEVEARVASVKERLQKG